MNTDLKKQPYSCHTFIFPFLWNDSGRVAREEFKKCINEGWVEDKPQFKEGAPNAELYNQYHYFNRAARNAIYTADFTRDCVVWNYRFDLNKFDTNTVKYIIQKGDFKAELLVKGMRLKLFNTGVGMLIFELENYEAIDEKLVIKINEFGRRVFLPYVFTDEKGDRACSLFPDNIGLSVGGKNIEGAFDSLKNVTLSDERDTVLISPITYLLSNDTLGITTKENHSDNEFYIETIIDDRMFVASIVADQGLADAVSVREGGEYKYLFDATSCAPEDNSNTARRLYEMMFVDGDGLSCYNREMLRTLLKKHIHGRWLERGSITGITEYSFVTVTNSPEYTVVPFLTQYIEMVVLALAQRASLLAFERIISEIACGKNDMSVDAVQRDYVMFQSELLLQEITAQQQGIELYDMLLENLFINKQQKEIEGQINSLLELNTSHHEKAENFILFILALFSISETVQIIFGDWFGLGNCICLVVSLICLALIGIWKISRNKKWRG